ncbi:OmpA family protein [Nocardioides sp. JQ2195]|uniref:OmpA family protein n=1 Tax=Nocardioides sp. JQ2195 TaxID=2592334 RepID=UPI00143E8540|nr:OmpA family protein [Nocardioides sp. JQ2195]QIX25355.1 OmpA family protein [Nocardioides sp. JQ2195]
MSWIARTTCLVLLLALFPGLLGATATATAAPAQDPGDPSLITPLPEIPDTVGTDFWVAFPDLEGFPIAYRLYLSPTDDGTVTVADASGASIETVSTSAGTISQVEIPAGQGVTSEDGVESVGVRVTSTSPISVFGAMIYPAASTGFQAYPIDALGTSYRVLGYNATQTLPGMQTRMTVIGSTDGTEVTITPKTQVGARPAGEPFTITLDEGQTYQLGSSASEQDVTGTEVTATAPVAVYGGNSCANVPTGFPACNPILQQLPPTQAWGTEFISGRFATRAKGDTYRVLADQDGTVVKVGGNEVATLDAGEFHEMVLPAAATEPGREAVIIEASKPVLVAQFGNGSSYDATSGDPLMMLVTPLGQHLTSYTLATPDIVSSGAGTLPWINLLVQTRDIGTLTLDGVPVDASEFTGVAGTDYSVAQLSASIGQHSLSAPHQFGVQVYAWGNYDAFGYSGGAAVAPIADAPAAPVATPLTSEAIGTQSATVTVGSQQEVRLLDGATLTDTVTVPGQGTYELDRTTGVITFTPLFGYAGVATPVTYRIVDAWNQQDDSTYTPTVLPPAAPVALPLTSSGTGTQSVVITPPTGGSVTLLDIGGVETTTVTVSQGTYVLDVATSTISFVPDAGETGLATPVDYRLIDAYNQTAESTYTPEVLDTVVPPEPKPDNPKATLGLPSFVSVAPGRVARVPATCAVRHAKIRSCKVTLFAKVGGDLTKVGAGSAKGKRVKVRLNAVGRAVAATPGGKVMKGQMTVRTTRSRKLWDRDRTQVVSRRFTLVRTPMFAISADRVRVIDASYLRAVGNKVRRVRTVTCTGFTDSQGSEAYNRTLGLRRAKAVCKALRLPSRVRVVTRTLGERRPVADNGTPAGRARNRRVTVTLHY